MSMIHYHAPIRLLVAVRGHPFDRNALDAMFQSLPGITATLVDQPAAAQLMNPTAMADYDALVLYDMPGLDFGIRRQLPAYVSPPDSLKAGLRALLEQGKGVVALHHALAGWPDWPEYGDWLGGRFLYRSGVVRDRACLDSGYAGEVTYDAEVLTEHPVTAGVPARFELTDELYLAEVHEAEVTPLLVTRHPFTAEHFASAAHAVCGRPRCRDDWPHPPGSPLIGWTKRALASRLVYLQPGDGAATFAHPVYRRLLENAIRFVIAPDT